MVGGTEDEHALVVGVGAVELGEEQVDDVAERGARRAQVGAALADRVELVEEQHTRPAAASLLEHVMEVVLALADPHVEDVVEADDVEAGTELSGEGPGDERLAAAGRPPQQQPATQRLAEAGGDLRIAQGFEERGIEALLDLIHAADVVQSDAGHGRALDADFDQRVVAGPLVEQFVGGVGDLVGSARQPAGRWTAGVVPWSAAVAAAITASAVGSVGAAIRTRDAWPSASAWRPASLSRRARWARSTRFDSSPATADSRAAMRSCCFV